MNRKIITTILIAALIFSNFSIVFGMEDTADSVNPVNETVTDTGLEPAPTDETTPAAVEPEVNPTDAGVQTTQTKQLKDDNKVDTAASYTHYVKVVDSAGNFKLVPNQNFTSAKSALSAMKTIYEGKAADKTYKGNKGLVVTEGTSKKVVGMMCGMAYFNSGAATATIGKTYITPKDALHFYSSSSTCKNSTVGINGAKASVATSKLILIPGSMVNAGIYKKDYYTKSAAGDLYHYVYKIKNPKASSQTSPYAKSSGGTGSYSVHAIDKAPSWMSFGKSYFTADGVNFYTDIDLKTRVGSHYSYFQYLPYRTMSNYTSKQLNSWIKSKTSSNSKLRSQGRNFINAQNRYGVNAVNELAFACLESAYGKSNLALTRNNLFGINAVDSSPGNAYSFSSARVCINQHAEKYLSKGYGDAKSDSRYFGLAPGNKGAGVNVKYASDPWHGEKISYVAYQIDKYLGRKDYRKYTLGVTNKDSVVVYKSAGKTPLYNLSTKGAGAGPTGISVAILGTSGSYYRIASDLPISGSKASHSYTYYFSKSVAYVKKSDINVINNGTHTYTSKIAKNKDLRNITVKVGKKNYLTGFNPGVTSYTVSVPKNTKKITINGTRLMTTSKVSGNGKKKLNKKTKTYTVKVSSKGGTKSYKIKVVPKGKAKSTFSFGIYNSKTKFTKKSKKGKKTTAKNPVKLQTKVKTNSKKTAVTMTVYNSKKKVVAKKTANVYKTKTVNFSWNGKYTKHNTLKKKSGKYATRSKKGTKYFVRFSANRGGTKHTGKYHTFYLYK